MSKMKARRTEVEDLLGGPVLEIPMLTSGEVTEILNIQMWRLERFLENYPLRAGQPGQGQGSRRLFSPDDVRRLFIAKWLLDDRFRPKLVADILQDLSDRRFIEYDKDGEELSLSLVLKRDPDRERTVVLFSSRSGKAPSDKNAYYSLDFDPLIAEVDQRIKRALEKRSKR